MDPIFWIVAGVLLVVAEVVTLTFVLGMVGAAALLTGGAAALGAGAPAQLVTFILSTVALLVLVRPLAKKHLTSTPLADAAEARALTGKEAVVTAAITDETGQVRLNGEFWRARSYAGGASIPAGKNVTVAEVDGATLMVYPSDIGESLDFTPGTQEITSLKPEAAEDQREKEQ